MDKRWVGWVMFAALGWAIGVAAWGEGRGAGVAALVPLAIAVAASRSQAIVLGVFYILASGRTVPGYASAWFDDNLLVGAGLWVAFSCIGGLAWSLCWTKANAPWRKAVAVLIGWLVALAPPVAMVVPGHAVIAWGYLAPQTAWFGVALSALLPAYAIYQMQQWNQDKLVQLGLVCACAIALFAGSFAYKPDETRYINDIVGVSTKWGGLQNRDDVLNRIEKMGRTGKALASEHLANVVIYPESILGVYDPGIYKVLEIEVLLNARSSGQVVIVGSDVPTKNGNYESTAIAFYPDGKSATAVARQPVPVALWKPWQAKDSFETNWFANNILTLRDGIRARVIFCYEEWIPVLSLINEAMHDHQLVVVMSNTWAAKNPLAAEIQRRHSEGIARLFGRPLVRAENRPKPTK